MDSGRSCSSFDSHPAAYVFPAEGDEVLISKNIHTNLERTVIGLTVLVRSLATATLILDANQQIILAMLKPSNAIHIPFG